MRWSGAFPVLAVAVLCMCLVGCGDDSASSTSLSNTPADTDTPLAGKELSKPNQLVGTWLFVNDGDFIGFEFMKDGKVLATPALAALAGLNNGVMMDYAVMDGGRLSLTAANGQTQVFAVTLSGDQLELKGSMVFSDTDVQRFRRLPAGQTLEQAFEEQQKTEAKARQEKYAALQAFLQKPGMVIVCTTTGEGAPASIAVSPQNDPAGQRAWHDDTPPHIDQISAHVDLNEQGKTPLVNVTYGQQLAPPPTQAYRGNTTIPFEVTGDAKNPRAVAKVNFNGRPFELELKQDEKLYKQIIARFDAEAERVEGLKKPLADLLKDYAILEGVSASEYTNQPRHDTARIILVRSKDGMDYTGEAVLIKGANNQAAPMPNTTAQITVIDNKPMLMVNCYNRQYQLSHDPATGRLTGGWFYTGNPNGFVADLAVVEAMDEPSRQARFAADRKVLQSLSPSEPLIGLVDHRVNFLPKPGPVALAMTVSPDGQASGTAAFSQVAAVIDVQGRITETISGPRLELQFANLRENGSAHAGNLSNMLRSQKWVYRVKSAADAGPTTLTDGASTLTQATEAYKTELKTKLTDALAAGLTMQIKNPDYGGNSEKQVFRFSIDSAGKITGQTIAGTNGQPFNAQSTVAGELTEWHGLPRMQVQIADPPPAKAGAFHRTYTAEILACPTADGWCFTAPYWPDTNNRARQYFDMYEVGQ